MNTNLALLLFLLSGLFPGTGVHAAGEEKRTAPGPRIRAPVRTIRRARIPASPAATPREEPRLPPRRLPEKVFRLEDDQIIPIERPRSLMSGGIDPEEEVLMVVQLRHISMDQAGKTLSFLLGQQKDHPHLRFLQASWTPALLLSGKAAWVDSALGILKALDVPERRFSGEPASEEPGNVNPPERRLETIELKHAEAETLADLIEAFLDQEGLFAEYYSSSTGRRPKPGTGSGTSRDPALSTKIIADARTGKLIVKTYSQEDLRDILFLVKELDIPVDGEKDS